MKKFILLIQPMHGSWDKLFCRLPESLLAIAAAPYKEGYNVKILDQRITPDWREKLASYIQQKPICVGITSLTGPSIEYALEAAQLVKRIDKNIKVVFGGIHVTLMPEQSIKNKNIDIIIKGEADYSFLKLVKAIEKNDSFDKIKGIYYKKNGKIKFTGEADLVLDLDSLPETPYNLVEMSKYLAVEFGKGKSVSLKTSRGCPYSCKFCSNAHLHKSRWRGLSIPKIVSKIEIFQKKYGYNTFFLIDDCTSPNIIHFRELIKALNGLKNKITWTTAGMRADLISKLNDEDLNILWKSGCKALDIGIESGSDRVLKYINKGETKDEMLIANKKLSKYPILVKYTLIIGYPTETDKEMNETIDFYLRLSKENPNSYALIFPYLPIVGTEMYQEAIKNNFKEPKTMEDWRFMDYIGWQKKYSSWISKEKKIKMEMISITSLFCNKNSRYKLTTNFSRIIFFLYHPIAKLRFKYKFFGFPIESLLRGLFF